MHVLWIEYVHLKKDLLTTLALFPSEHLSLSVLLNTHQVTLWKQPECPLSQTTSREPFQKADCASCKHENRMKSFFKLPLHCLPQPIYRHHKFPNNKQTLVIFVELPASNGFMWKVYTRYNYLVWGVNRAKAGGVVLQPMEWVWGNI